MTWPTSDVVRTNADDTTDSPATFRADVLDLIDKFNLMRNHVSVFVRGLLSAADAAAARTTLVAAASGSNTDITSLGAVTGVTAAERDNSTKLATTAYVDRAGVPVGTIIAYAGPTIPTGYLVLPTAATNISRTTYAALFAAIGTYFGAGDGSTTFGMPYVIDDGTIVHSPAHTARSRLARCWPTSTRSASRPRWRPAATMAPRAIPVPACTPTTPRLSVAAATCRLALARGSPSSIEEMSPP